MAILGCGGIIELRREAPEPTVLRPGNVHVSTKSIYMRNPAFWSGDEVTLSCANGLPFDTASNGPDCPDGYGMYYGSQWFLGANRDHITDELDPFYTGTNNDRFYMRAQECGLTQTATYFMYRDQLDRISFYATREAAMNGLLANRIDLYKVDFNGLIVSASGSSEYENAIAQCATDIGEYQFSDVQDEVTLESICDFAPDFLDPPAWITEYDNADLTPRYWINAGADGSIWRVQGQLTEWSLNLLAPEVDTTSVGERFGESVKSIITGGGTMDFLVERDQFSDSTVLMRLLLLTEKGCKAAARFWMINDASASGTLLPGDLYYETELLVTSTAVNTRPDDVIAGSMNFVTVGEIALRMGPN